MKTKNSQIWGLFFNSSLMYLGYRRAAGWWAASGNQETLLSLGSKKGCSKGDRARRPRKLFFPPLLGTSKNPFSNSVWFSILHYKKGINHLNGYQNRSWSAHPVRRGWDSWASTAWSTEGFGVTQQEPKCLWEVLGEMEPALFTEGWVRGWNKVDTDWYNRSSDWV